MFYPGEIIDDRYVVRDLLGSGNSGEVYAVYDEGVEQELALKIQPARVLESTRSYREWGDSLGEEVVASQCLREVTGLVRALGSGTHQGREYYVMDNVGGRDLVDFADREGAVSSDRTAAVVTQLCDIIGGLHSHGWVHRDIKLENALIDDGGRVWLIDLGSAVEGDADVDPAGTPGYIAPEIVAGDPATPRSDIFSLGCLLFRMSIMRFPYVNKTGWRPEVAPPFPDDLGRALDALNPVVREVGLRMIAWNPNDRPQSTREVADALRSVLPGPVDLPQLGRKPDPVRWYWLSTYAGEA
ncbi:serine/threonine-protein kinase [Actinokineospora inagensis]|uniref:serine/threonine-protein kinase n=1 Tax=Actinokineospora inagensis TaxID=103730 RepID=UPI00047AED80|nr:serine/threonine-protein kinase [Actinokineospora inagensis]